MKVITDTEISCILTILRECADDYAGLPCDHIEEGIEILEGLQNYEEVDGNEHTGDS